MTHAHTAAMGPPAEAAAGAGVYNEKLGMWIFLGSEVMFFTALIGGTFVAIQVFEYVQLVHHGFMPSGYREGAELTEAAAKGVAWKGGPALPASVGLYGSTFFTMTGFHGFHVTLGVLCMLYVTWQAFRGKYSATDHRGVEVIGLYWHFVDLVWIVLFTIVYLI